MKILILLIGVLTCVLIVAKPMTARSEELPDYTVEMVEGAFEIRAYPPLLLAEVTVDGDRDRAASRGFRKLAGFIFGDNQTKTSVAMTSPVMQKPASQKIAMTAPVMQTPETDGRWTINFMMPSKFTLNNLPVPNDPDIRIYESAPYRTVSIRFSGRNSEKNLSKHREKLEAFIASKGLRVSDTPEYAFYDAPWVPFFSRRNEVHYRLSE